MKLHTVFIYGTLKKGHYWHNEYIGKHDHLYMGKYKTNKDVSMYIDALPFAVKETSEDGIIGEVYQVDDATLRNIDKLETCPVFCQREKVEVVNESGEKVLAWIYLHPNKFRWKKDVFKEQEWE